MYTIKVDPHTHTLMSGHAFSTIEENAIHAKERELEAIAMTDHFGYVFSPERHGRLDFGPMMNMGALPQVIHGIRILAGVEIDIVDFKGNLACYDKRIQWGPNPDVTVVELLLGTREVGIASVHGFEGFRSGTVAQNTEMYINAIRTPGINIIGHCGRTGMPFDIDELLTVAKEQGKMIEINDHSFDSDEPVPSTCKKIALRCAEMGVKIVVSSDAHSSFFVGDFKRALAMLEEIHFPNELIANTTLAGFLKTLETCSK